MILCELDQRVAGLWNFRTEPAPRQRTDLLRPHDAAGDAGPGAGPAESAGDKRGRAEGSAGDDLFTDPAKRAKVLGGGGEALAAQARGTFFNSAAWGSQLLYTTVWGLVSPDVERITLGHRWAQAPLGALTQPAPSPGRGVGLAGPRGPFHPVKEHRPVGRRNPKHLRPKPPPTVPRRAPASREEPQEPASGAQGSPWTAAPFPLLPASAVPAAALAAAPAWQQCLCVALSLLRTTRAGAGTVPRQGAVEGPPGAESLAERREDPVREAHLSLERWMP